MHIDQNQFYLSTMSNKKNTNTVSIFNKSKATKQIVNHIAKNHVNSLFSTATHLDDDMEYLTQHDKGNPNQTQDTQESNPERKLSDEKSTELQNQESTTNETNISDSEVHTETNDVLFSPPRPKQGQSANSQKSPPVITPQAKNTKKTDKQKW